MGYLSQRALNGLKEYKYKPGGYTFLDIIHAPTWDWCVAQLPMWLAPNLITLTGLVLVIISYLCNAYIVPDFIGAAPVWLHLLNAISVVIYVNLDCLDGKQARRTKSSSPLGQLFDHGCDALSVHLLLGNTQVALGSPCGKWSAIMQFLLMLPWVLAHLEEYHTGSLLYGNGLVGVLEANYALAALSLVSAVAGTKVWDTPIGKFIPGLPTAFGQQYVLRHAFFWVAAAGCISIAIGQLGRLLGLLSPSATLTPSETGNKCLGKPAVISQLLMLGVILACGTVWQADAQQLKVGQCRLAGLTYGIVYALVSTQLILAHMAKEPFKPSSWAFLVLAVGAANSVLRVMDPLLLGAILAASTSLAYLHYVTSVVQQVCMYLHIKCFTINPTAKHDDK